MLGEFHSRKRSHSKKLEQRPRIFVKVSFRELCDSELSNYLVIYLHLLMIMLAVQNYEQCMLIYVQ